MIILLCRAFHLLWNHLNSHPLWKIKKMSASQEQKKPKTWSDWPVVKIWPYFQSVSRTVLQNYACTGSAWKIISTHQMTMNIAVQQYVGHAWLHKAFIWPTVCQLVLSSAPAIMIYLVLSVLMHWSLNTMADILQMAFWNAFSWMKF